MWDYRFEPSQRSGNIGCAIAVIGILLTVISMSIAVYQISAGDNSFNVWIPTIIFAIITIVGVGKMLIAADDQELIILNDLYHKHFRK